MNLAPGDVCLVDFGSFPFGHEQAGIRPAIFVSMTAVIAVVIPLTSNTNASRYGGTATVHPDESNGLAKESVALIFHLRSIDKRRISKRIGTLSTRDIRAINKTIRTVALVAR